MNEDSQQSDQAVWGGYKIDQDFETRSEIRSKVATFNETLNKEELAFYYSEHFESLMKKLFADAIIDVEIVLTRPVMNADLDDEFAVKELVAAKRGYEAELMLMDAISKSRMQRLVQVNEALNGKGQDDT